METEKCLEIKKRTQESIIQFLDEDQDEISLIIDYLQNPQYHKYWESSKEKFHLILEIANNYKRLPSFYKKIEQITLAIQEEIKQSLANSEIFRFFQINKIILLILLKNKIIIPDELIYESFCSKNPEEENFFDFLFPEFQEFIPTNTSEIIKSQIYAKTKLHIENSEDLELFEIKRKRGTNDSYICTLIQNDSIQDFVQYINENNFNLTSIIEPSIFETNLFLLTHEKTSLIEYAAFYGSIQIFNYLKENKVELESSLWLYAIHSCNAELIQILEEKKVEIHSDVFEETIKCHFFDFANYFINNEMIKRDFSIGIRYNNYSFYPENLTCSLAVCYYCKYGYYNFLKILLEDGFKFDNNNKNEFSKTPTQIAADQRNLRFISLFLDYAPSIENLFGNSAFEKCYKLKQITIPSSVTAIGCKAFYDCKTLIDIEIPSSVTLISEKAFESCYSLKQITIPSSVTSIGDNAFCKCISLKEVIFENPCSIKIIPTRFCGECSSLEQITIPSSVITIEYSAFISCSSLKEISFPSSLKDLYGYAFYNCRSLKHAIFDKSCLVNSINNCTFLQCFEMEYVVLPSSLISIEHMAFYKCHSLKDVVIPASVVTIGSHAFNDCTSLKNIIFEHNSSLKTIYQSAFCGCKNLGEIWIPYSVIKVDCDAFNKCPSLKIAIPHHLNNIGYAAFEGCTACWRY